MESTSSDTKSECPYDEKHPWCPASDHHVILGSTHVSGMKTDENLEINSGFPTWLCFSKLLLHPGPFYNCASGANSSLAQDKLPLSISSC